MANLIKSKSKNYFGKCEIYACLANLLPYSAGNSWLNKLMMRLVYLEVLTPEISGSLHP